MTHHNTIKLRFIRAMTSLLLVAPLAASCVTSVDEADDELVSADESEAFRLGTAGDDTIAGTSSDDVIAGLGGNDTLSGGAGNDQLLGGPGRDELNGDAGADVLNGDDGNDFLNGGAGNDDLRGGAGEDTLDGGAGADLLTGGLGNDRYTYDGTDTIVEDPNGGSDNVVSTVTLTMPANCEGITLAGTSNIGATGNAGRNGLTGNSGNNSLVGLHGNDFIEGRGGADAIDGGPGNDNLYGGEGNDTYLYGPDDNVDEIVDVNGTDRIQFKPGIQRSQVTLDVRGDKSLDVFVDGSLAMHVACGDGSPNPSGQGGPVESFRFADESEIPANQIPSHCR